MAYADQTLAQLLLRRALTDDEAREMLLPMLDALAFLHGRNLVQGRLKPANILVVGEQLKLASDTIHRAGRRRMSTSSPTLYEPPEARHASSSTAGDIWALGVSVFEALTRRAPSGLGEPRGAVQLPADFSPEFRDVVAQCLSVSPQDRPSVTELGAWARRESPSAALVPPEPTTPEALLLAAPEPVAPAAAAPEPVAPAAAAPEPVAPAAAAPEPVAPAAAAPEPVAPAAAAPEPVDPAAAAPAPPTEHFHNSRTFLPPLSPV